MPTQRIPLFPLANVVLFPEAVTPLHVFEPRYRQMTAAALAGERVIGMATVRPEHLGDMAGDPPLYGIGCAGLITQHQHLADGRYNLVLRGSARFRIVAEPDRPPEQLYRVAEVEMLEERDGEASDQDVAALRASVVAQLRDVATRTLGEASAAFDPGRLDALPLIRFANGVSQAIGLPAPEKQSLLEAPDAVERLRRLDGALRFHLAALDAGAAGSQAVH